jgi:hypothetical protein
MSNYRPLGLCLAAMNMTRCSSALIADEVDSLVAAGVPGDVAVRAALRIARFWLGFELIRRCGASPTRAY